MTTNVYFIRTLTNLHAGSGDAGYGVVDKLVQRDPTTDLPTIQMSGIKGALRAFLTSKITPDELTNLFGSPPQAEATKVQQGSLRFLSAELLALPGPDRNQDTGRKAYQLFFDSGVKSEFEHKVKLFGLKDWTLPQNDWVSDAKSFRELADDLPVIARNYLDNGESKNLWYEEIVPREACFACIIQGPDKEIEILKGKLDEAVVQVGGNATVGYGYCLFKLI